MLTPIVSQRGVVFFRRQNDLTDELQKSLVQRLGELTGKPKTSKLHIHPFFHSSLPLGGGDDELNVISTAQDHMVFGKPKRFVKRQNARQGWHTDICHETVPSDYSLLRLVELPKGGGGGIVMNICQYTFDVTNVCHRHSVGLGLRDVRSHLKTISAIPRDLDRHLQPADLREPCKENESSIISRSSRVSREHQVHSSPSSYSYKPRDRLEEPIHRRDARKADQ